MTDLASAKGHAVAAAVASSGLLPGAALHHLPGTGAATT